AFSDFNFGIGFDSSNSRLYFQRSLIYKQRTEHEKAIADLDEALRLDPQYGMAYNHRGQAHALRKEYELALADFDQAIRFEPGADAYNQKAWLLATCPDDKLRNGQTAIELATKACQLTDWKNAGWIDTLAAAYAEVGDFDKAVEMQERALKGVNSKARKEFEARLELYREHKPYRE
ncbi:MAG TPA: tetratricopeptide repeat protein, partial [Planctomycetaceae bacterium]|nr:tetratricopeptide repeat protein [Planctomycetaceae bacterium]